MSPCPCAAILIAGVLLAACGPAAPRTRAQAANDDALANLRARLEARIAQTPGGEVAVAVVDLATGHRIDIAGDSVMHAASTMKVPVLYELFHQVEAGRLSLDDSLPVQNRFRSLVGDTIYTLSVDDDSDSTLYRRVGTRASIRELARLMIVRSSNFATNLLIDRVGAASVRATMDSLGAGSMRVLRGVEDGPAFRKGMNNTTTANAFATLLEAIARCRGLQRTSCDAMIDILSAQEFNENDSRRHSTRHPHRPQDRLDHRRPP